MKKQKVTVIVNDIESNGIISLENNTIDLNMGITNQIIDFRDISVYDKKSNSTLGLVLKNNKSIDLSFKDYLLLYKIIDDFMKKQSSTKKRNEIKCPECDTINDNKNIECSNCGYPLKTKNKFKNTNISKKRLIRIISITIVIMITLFLICYFLNPSYKTASKSSNNTNNHSTTNNNSASNKKTKDLADKEMKEKSEKVFSTSIGPDIADVIYIGYNNKNMRCQLGCYEIEYIKNGENVKMSYDYDSERIEFDCKETDTTLTCYMKDGKTVYAEYSREK